jgi:hypothetical protein
MTSFAWSSYAGLWSIYTAGNELGSLSKEPEWKKIAAHLTRGIPDVGGIDLKVITKTPWSKHQDSYTSFILTQGAILFEDWTGKLAEMTDTPGKKVKAETFQFPSGSVSKNYINWAALDASGSLAVCDFLKDEIQPSLTSTHAANLKNLDAMLRWYRYFKELRNAVAHHGGTVSQRALDAYTEASATSLSSAGLKPDLLSASPTLGAKVSIPLSDAVLFLGLIQRLAFAFDAKYCQTTHAEADLKVRVANEVLLHPAPKTATSTKKLAWVKNFMNHRVKVKVIPVSVAKAEAWLNNNGLVKIKSH